MIVIFSVILFVVFELLGFIHFYWLFGGKWGVEKVIPTKENQSNVIQIPKLATLIVALILVSFGILYFVKSGLINVHLPSWLLYIYWIIPSLFILRAIGDFKYVGFFKKIKHTAFAKADSRIFSPICLLIGIMGVLINITA